MCRGNPCDARIHQLRTASVNPSPLAKRMARSLMMRTNKRHRWPHQKARRSTGRPDFKCADRGEENGAGVDKSARDCPLNPKRPTTRGAAGISLGIMRMERRNHPRTAYMSVIDERATGACATGACEAIPGRTTYRKRCQFDQTAWCRARRRASRGRQLWPCDQQAPREALDRRASSRLYATLSRYQLYAETHPPSSGPNDFLAALLHRAL
jgi:hypothetical protein